MIQKKWFSNNPKSRFLTKYIQSTVDKNIIGMTKTEFRTILIDLTKPGDQLLNECDTTCRNEIRRGIKINLEFEARLPILEDINFISDFQIGKGLREFNNHYKNNINAVVCRAGLNDQSLVTHLYIIGENQTTVRLVYSAVIDSAKCNLKVDSLATQRLISIANRFLHYRSILYFKLNSFKIYDLGGIGANEGDPKIKGINFFKRGFGGSESIGFNYTPIWIKLVEKIIKSKNLNYFNRDKI